LCQPGPRSARPQFSARGVLSGDVATRKTCGGRREPRWSEIRHKHHPWHLLHPEARCCRLSTLLFPRWMGLRPASRSGCGGRRMPPGHIHRGEGQRSIRPNPQSPLKRVGANLDDHRYSRSEFRLDSLESWASALISSTPRRLRRNAQESASRLTRPRVISGSKQITRSKVQTARMALPHFAAPVCTYSFVMIDIGG